jgi:hypothetical protein
MSNAEVHGSADFRQAAKAANFMLPKSRIKGMTCGSAFLWEIWSTLAMNMSQSRTYSHVEAE